MVIANWRAVGVANYLLKNWSRFSLGLPATWIWGVGSAWIGNRLGVVVQVVSAASQRYDFVLRLIASALHMACKQPAQGQRGSLRWNFSVDFESDLMGRFVVTDEHLVRI
jgi:hypothetical protein